MQSYNNRPSKRNPYQPASSRYSYYRPGQRRPARRTNPRTLFFLGLITLISVGAVVLSIALSVNSGRESERQMANLPYSTIVPTAEPTPGLTVEPTAALAIAPVQSAAPQTQTGTAATVDTYTVLSGIPQTDRAIGLAECEPVPDSYFDDAVFIGDSVTLKLNYYVRDKRKEIPNLLGGAQFLTAGSMGSGNALKAVSESSIHPSYQGQKMALEDAVAAMGAKKVYIMLGMNDIAVYGADEAAQNLMRLARRILDKSPDAKIFIQSATPRLKGDYNKLNNNALFEYDLKLHEYSQQFADYGIYFVDVAYVMRDAEGNLPANYCSDPDGQALHFTSTACQVWIDYLYTHALTTGAGI